MAWLKNEKIKDGQVSVNTKIFDIDKHGLVQVENPDDIRIFCRYLHFEEIPDVLAQKIIEEAEGAKKEGETTKASRGKAKGADESKG